MRDEIESVAGIDAQVASAGFPRVTLTLSRTIDGNGAAGWVIENIATSSRGFRWNMTYADATPMEDAIHAELVSALDDYLPADDAPKVLTAANFLLELPYLVLNRLTLTGLGVRDGVQRVRVAFQRVMGDLRRLFRANRAPDILSEANDVLATRVLADLMMPLLNLVEGLPDAVTDTSHLHVNRLLTRLKAQHHDLAFHFALMTRFVANANRAVPDTADVLVTIPHASYLQSGRVIASSG